MLAIATFAFIGSFVALLMAIPKTAAALFLASLLIIQSVV